MPARRNWDQAAGVLWPVLTGAASAAKLVTYSDVALLIQTNPLSVGRALGPMQTYYIEAQLPPLTAIVVGKTRRTPGNGFIAWDVDDFEEGLEAVFRYPWDTVDNPFVGFIGGMTEASFATLLIENPDSAGDIYGRVKNRGVAQRIFRRALLECYSYKCCMCGLSFEEALEAAHIIPWSEATHADRLDVRNGLLLCSTHHRMFDAAAITITEKLKIEYADPDGGNGDYSEIDRTMSVDLHNCRVAKSSNGKLAPSGRAIRRRRIIDGWD